MDSKIPWNDCGVSAILSQQFGLLTTPGGSSVVEKMDLEIEDSCQGNVMIKGHLEIQQIVLIQTRKYAFLYESRNLPVSSLKYATFFMTARFELDIIMQVLGYFHWSTSVLSKMGDLAA
jgi:hypothetical protein